MSTFSTSRGALDRERAVRCIVVYVTTYIALFRGINVGGNQILPMKALKTILEKSACSDVRTYIQSGNAVFRRASRDAAALSKQLAVAVSKSHGFEPRVLARTLKELEKASAANPFPEAEGDPKSVHLFFLAERAKKPDLKALEALRTPTERFILKDKVFYLHTPDGLGRSKLAARAEKLLGVEATARNWRTVKTLIEMAKS
ncbi:MAG TPA: DUF1697 domain-containing protein [Vicinamibacterales bacterium]|nr:DUF1697 domain-containing protein [Vicinamibacterales bacterium]